MSGVWIGCLMFFAMVHQDTIDERTRNLPFPGTGDPRFDKWARSLEIPIEGNIPKETESFSPVPFINPWKNFELAARGASGHWRFSGQSLRFTRGVAGPSVLVDPFWRAQLESIQVEQFFNEGEGKTLFRLGVAWHPRLSPVLIQAGGFQLQYGLPNGEKRRSTTKPTSWIPIDQSFNTTLELSGGPIPRIVQKVDLVSGEVRVVAPERLAWVSLGTLESPGQVGMEKKVGSTQVRRVGQKITPNRLSLEVEIKPGPSHFVLESYQENSLIGPARIVSSPGGVPIMANGYTTVQNTNGWIRIRYDWLRKENQPLQGLAVGEVEVRIGDCFVEKLGVFEFRDIPLP